MPPGDVWLLSVRLSDVCAYFFSFPQKNIVQDPVGVTIGGCMGHSVCTGMAVVGGRMLASRISEKSVAFYGGLTFLVFGIHSVFFEE